METTAVVLHAPERIRLDTVKLKEPSVDDLVVKIRHSAISTGTEKLLFTGAMPDFPGMGYPLVPGYESTGEVVEAGALSGFKPGDTVFVPGSDCYRDVKGLFGGNAATVVCSSERLQRVDPILGETAALMALAATARHAIAGLNTPLPDLIVGHGVMGRLLARLTLAAGGPPPTVWEVSEARREGVFDYPVIHPDDDQSKSYQTIYDVSGDLTGLDGLIGRLKKGGEVVLAGFYAAPVQFAFPPAFMREARIRVAAEWTPRDMLATRLLIEEGHLDLGNLITHTAPASEAAQAYRTAFDDPRCLKMCLNWEGSA